MQPREEETIHELLFIALIPQFHREVVGIHVQHVSTFVLDGRPPLRTAFLCLIHVRMTACEKLRAELIAKAPCQVVIGLDSVNDKSPYASP